MSATWSSSKPGPAGADWPNPGTSTAITRRPRASGSITRRQIRRLVATPCSSTSGSPSPRSSRPSSGAIVTQRLRIGA
jgi:hypothetical protein